MHNNHNKHLLTALPGPNSLAMIERDSAVVSPSYPRDYPFVMSHGKGAEVWDVDGNRFIDFASGIAVCSTGHSHPKVVQAVKDAADKFLHISSDYWHEEQVHLAETLNRLSPFGEPAMTFFCNSGTEAVEGAIKLARYVTGRSRFIGFIGGFHGRTMGSLAFTASKYTQQAGFFPSMPGVTHIPYPNNYRPLLAGEDQGDGLVRDLARWLIDRPASGLSAIAVAPPSLTADTPIPRRIGVICDGSSQGQKVREIAERFAAGFGSRLKAFEVSPTDARIQSSRRGAIVARRLTEFSARVDLLISGANVGALGHGTHAPLLMIKHPVLSPRPTIAASAVAHSRSN